MAIDLQSMVNTHECPFVIIDREFRIVAINRAYQEAYQTDSESILGRRCYEVSHHKDRPCFEEGEVCPHEQVFRDNKGCHCMHLHHDDQGRVHRLRILAYPLKDSNGEIYLGEVLQELAEPEAQSQERITRMIGEAPVFQRVLEQLKVASFSDAPVLLEGETGTGKDLAANFIHTHSPRSEKPFLTLDCTVLSESLFEAEVFGHERGAFTGSVGEKEGLFEVADGGTLFLDEIGEMSASLQAKMLRVLETGEFRRVGGRKTLRTDARIICATNRDLGKEVEAKLFREDLYYRVACLHVRLPALRERRSDIPLLAEVLLKRLSESAGRRFTLSEGALEVLMDYHYPGNVRELRNILSAAAAQSIEGTIRRVALEAVLTRMRLRRPSVTPDAAHASNVAGSAKAPVPGGESVTLNDLESLHISQLLKRCGGSRRKLATLLGISERTVYRKLKRYNLA